MPNGLARVFKTEIFYGWQFSSTKNAVLFEREIRWAIVIASAQAVASSKREAFAISNPVRSEIIV
jgi:hypothetical protein